ARVTVEDCLEKVGNRFALVILAAERARQLSKGARPLVRCDNKPAVTALREIADGRVKFTEDVTDMVDQHLKETRARGIVDAANKRQQRKYPLRKYNRWACCPASCFGSSRIANAPAWRWRRCAVCAPSRCASSCFAAGCTRSTGSR